jgi:hypothetical protein
MNKYAIRFNKTAGQPGRGSPDHVWRVFENDKEYVCKGVRINVPSQGQKTGEDWSIVCHGFSTIDRETSTITITAKKPKQRG